MAKNFEALKKFTRTMRQEQVLELIITNNGSLKAAAKELGCSPSTVQASVVRIEKYAAMVKGSRLVDKSEIPHEHYLKGLSTLNRVDKETGEREPILEWVKTNAKLQDQLDCLREFAEGLGEEVVRAVPVQCMVDHHMEDLLTVYPIADLHLGMLAWADECGDSYDAKIASRALRMAAEVLTMKSEPTETAIVANLGDFFHFDNDDQQTKASGAKLDGDGRWSKVVRLGVQGLKHFIECTLAKHKFVKVINSIGNHDDQSSLMLPLILEPHYQNEPRVTIESAPRFHHYHEFGANLLGFHHGHKVKPAALSELMMADQREAMGRTKFSHWLTGHIHHESKEYRTCLVESFRTLAAKDSYHSSNGYRALRDIQSLTYHREFGECGRNRVSYAMLQAMTR
jgi:hypothetical protein